MLSFFVIVRSLIAVKVHYNCEEKLVILFNMPRHRLNLMGQSKRREPYLLDLAIEKTVEVYSS